MVDDTADDLRLRAPEKREVEENIDTKHVLHEVLDVARQHRMRTVVGVLAVPRDDARPEDALAVLTNDDRPNPSRICSDRRKQEEAERPGSIARLRVTTSFGPEGHANVMHGRGQLRRDGVRQRRPVR